VTSHAETEPAAPDIGRPALPAGHHVEVPGRGSMFVREVPGPPGAPTALLLHGAAVTGALNFHTCYQPLARHVGVVSLDHRGHGRSFRSRRRFRLEDAADDAIDLADELELGELIVVGYSLGGAVAQLVWRRNPERVQALVLCATWSRYYRNGREKGLMRTVGRLGTGTRLLSRRKRIDMFMTAAAKYSSVDRRPPWMLAEVRAGSVPMMVEAIATVANFDSSSWIGDIDVPVGLIVLNHDDVVPPDRQHHLASLLPGADVRYLDLLHDGCVTEPDRFVPTLVDVVLGVIDRMEP
jgi:pimeloyl-ACP methyl ester carboxylesterase